MAESFINVTEGSGKKVHTFQRTIGANPVEDEVVIVGESYLPTYIMNTGSGVVTTTANSHLFQLMAGGSLNYYLRRLTIWQLVLAGAATIVQLELLRLTTAGTGGTAVTPSAHDSADGATSAAGMTLPTVKGTEGNRIMGASLAVLAAVPTGGGEALKLLDRQWPVIPNNTKSVRVPAGTTNGLAVKNVTALATSTLLINMEYVEASF